MKNKIDPWKLEAIVNMGEGDTIELDYGRVFRYKDGWHLYWDQPGQFSLGKKFTSEIILRGYFTAPQGENLGETISPVAKADWYDAQYWK